MATGADIPPELIQQILLDVCEDAEWLLDLRKTVPNRKEAIKNITACSLTCVYWAHVCRKQLYQRVWIKNYEDMRAFAQLVSNTPTRFRPISEHVFWATLVQRVGGRPWLHLIRMQPSLSQFWPSLHSNVRIYLHIENSPNDATSLQSSTSQRLFASLPRTPPSSCLQCAELTIDNSYFMTPHDLVSFLQKFSPCDSLRLTNVAWSAQADFASDLFARDLLLISPFSHLNVEVHRSAYTAETAWLAFSTTLRGLSTQGSTVTSASAYDGHDEDEHGPALQVLPSAQRAIFDICKSVCKVPSLNYVRFLSTGTPRGKDTGAVAYYICTTTIKEYKPAVDGLLPKIRLVFFGAPAVIPVTNISDSIVIDSISFILARIRAQSTTEPSNVGHSSDELPNTIASPWPEIVGLCAAQPGFMRLQLEFGSHDHLVQSMEAQCAALGKLHGRVALFYYAKNEGLRAADSETLADKGDADDYGYIDAVDLW